MTGFFGRLCACCCGRDKIVQLPPSENIEQRIDQVRQVNTDSPEYAPRLTPTPQSPSYESFAFSSSFNREVQTPIFGSPGTISRSFSEIQRRNTLNRLQQANNSLEEAWENRLQREQEEHEQRVEEISAEFQKQIENLNNTIISLENERNKYLRSYQQNQRDQQTIAEQTEEIRKNRFLLQEKNEKLGELEEQLTITKIKLCNLGDLEKTIEELNNDIALLQSEIKKKQQEIQILKTDNNEKNITLQDFQEEVAKLTNKIELLEAKLKHEIEKKEKIRIEINKLIQIGEQQDEREVVLLSKEEEIAEQVLMIQEKFGQIMKKNREEIYQLTALVDKQEKQMMTAHEKSNLLKERNQNLYEQIKEKNLLIKELQISIQEKEKEFEQLTNSVEEEEPRTAVLRTSSTEIEVTEREEDN